ncbi:hypothetical protein SF83666_a41340 (plasmid) [Sinorhizobium fredii CCBAU 83666]|nr:hypothetical protein SF83666_a41340 [Sinorhizobium fredii CCBAU 83666]
MMEDGGSRDSAARVLREIDRVRDESGAPKMSRGIPIWPPESRGLFLCPIPTWKTAADSSNAWAGSPDDADIGRGCAAEVLDV